LTALVSTIRICVVRYATVMHTHTHVAELSIDSIAYLWFWCGRGSSHRKYDTPRHIDNTYSTDSPVYAQQ